MRVDQDWDREPAESSPRLYCLNATNDDRARLSSLLSRLNASGFAETVWPADHELLPEKTIITVWSSDSVADSEIVERADRAAVAGRHIPIQIDDVQPLIGFRQLQTLAIRDTSADSLDLLLRHLASENVRARSRTRPAEFGWVYNILMSVAFAIVASAVIHALRLSLSVSAPIVDFFVYPCAAAMLLLGCIVRQPRLFGREAFTRAHLTRLASLDLASQFIAWTAVSSCWIITGLIDPRLLGGSDISPWTAPAAAGAAVLAGLTLRWVVLIGAYAMRRQKS